VEHIKSKSKGGSNKFRNLTLACDSCNKSKGNKAVEEFLSDKPEILSTIKTHVQKSLSDAAAVNSTRNKLFEIAKKTGLKIMEGSGALAKLVRVKSNLPKTHWIDAAANSLNEQPIKLLTHQPLLVSCKGHGNRQAVRCNNSGFPAITVIWDKQGQKVVKVVKAKQVYDHGCTGDIVKIRVDKDRKHISGGVYIARVKTPTKTGIEVKINGYRITSKLYNFLHRNDGYDYSFGQMLSI
jgi:hypothetical protein